VIALVMAGCALGITSVLYMHFDLCTCPLPDPHNASLPYDPGLGAAGAVLYFIPVGNSTAVCCDRGSSASGDHDSGPVQYARAHTDAAPPTTHATTQTAGACRG
jgi:hypothetical protein